MTSDFAEYFEKLSKCIAQITIYCPRLSDYEKLFGGSERLQGALSDLYATIVTFCSKALLVVQEKGKREDLGHQISDHSKQFSYFRYQAVCKVTLENIQGRLWTN